MILTFTSLWCREKQKYFQFLCVIGVWWEVVGLAQSLHQQIPSHYSRTNQDILQLRKIDSIKNDMLKLGRLTWSKALGKVWPPSLLLIPNWSTQSYAFWKTFHVKLGNYEITSQTSNQSCLVPPKNQQSVQTFSNDISESTPRIMRM